MRRRVILADIALLATLALAAAPVVAPADETEIGGSVSSTLSLGLDQSGAAVRATVTTTEPGTRLSVAPQTARSGLSAELAAGPYAPLDPAFGLTLVAWDDVLAGKATTLHLRSASAAATTVLITLSAATP
jgi:hypothetical protein